MSRFSPRLVFRIPLVVAYKTWARPGKLQVLQFRLFTHPHSDCDPRDLWAMRISAGAGVIPGSASRPTERRPAKKSPGNE